MAVSHLGRPETYAGTVAVGLCVTVVITVVVTGFPAGHALVVENADTGEQLLSVPVDDGAEVELSYVHSVEKTPVEETYVVSGTDLAHIQIEFNSYGAGLPSTADVERTDDGAFVASVDRTYRQVYVSPGEIAGHDLTIDGERHDLLTLSEGETVRIYVTEQNPIDRVAQVMSDA